MERSPPLISSPESQASLLSLLTWNWLNPLIALGNPKALQAGDLYQLTLDDRALHLCEQWNEAIEDLRKKTGTQTISVWKALSRSLGKAYFLTALWKPVWLAAVILQVYVLKALVNVAKNEAGHFRWWWGMLLVMGMFLGSTTQSLSQNNLFNTSQRIGMRARAVVSMAVFDKLLSLNLVAAKQSTDGTLLNLINNNTQKLIDAGTYFHFGEGAILSLMYNGSFQGGEP
ncbi:hypothetical protein L7F22_055161 [Adiantum nelumboides]|nr:hypothetical protein [Adiantum nelumboides]